MVVKEGDLVKVDYVLSIDGNVYDTSMEDVAENIGKKKFGKDYSPLVFEVGSRKIIKGLNGGVLGMSVGEKKEFIVSPSEGYGFYDEKRVQTLPRSLVERGGVDVTPGTRLMLNLRSGRVVAVVTELTEDDVTLDMNPDLCGKTLNFQVHLREILPKETN